MMSFRLLLLVLGCAAIVQEVKAQASLTPLVVPSNAYPGDHIFVPLVSAGACQTRLDPDRPPQIRGVKVFDPIGEEYDTYHYDVAYWLIKSVAGLCIPPSPPPRPLFPVDVGALPRGVHLFRVTGHLEEATFPTYETSTTWVRDDHGGLPSDISGLWHDPSQSGRGLSVVPSRDGNITMFWATHDSEGKSLWVVSNGPATGPMTFGGSALRTSGPPLASGPSTSPQQPWGQIKFTYVGCGRARLEWTPLDATTASGTQTLVKLTQSRFEPRCSLDAQARAVWVD